MEKTSTQIIEELALTRKREDIKKREAAEKLAAEKLAELQQFWRPVQEIVDALNKEHRVAVSEFTCKSLQAYPHFYTRKYLGAVSEEVICQRYENGTVGIQYRNDYGTRKTAASVADLIPELMDLLANVLKAFVKENTDGIR